MNKKQFIIASLATVLCTGISIYFDTNSTFAFNNKNMSWNKINIQANIPTTGTQSYIDTNALTGEQKTLFDNANQTFTNQIDNLKSQYVNGSGDRLSFQSGAINIWKTYMNTIRPLVATGQLSGFDNFVAQGPTNFQFIQLSGSNYTGSNGTGNHYGSDKGRWKNKDKDKGKDSIKDKNFKYIVGNTYTAINTKLDSLSTDQLNSVLNKINTALSNGNITNQRLIRIYKELRIMINEKLGNTNDANPENILDNLLK